jgi:enoyl-CoA hydratase/3-hydroxyacyl-CoA dehydrogenase
MGPFFLTDLLGLDTVLHVAEHMHESYGEHFYVHKGLQGLVGEGKLGAKTGGEGFFKDGEQNVPGDAEPDAEELVAMFSSRALIEACLLVEEGICSVRDIDLGMMAGAGIIPPPFARADQLGLDEVLAKLENAQREWGDNFAAPTILRRLVAQGRLGVKTGQGFFPYARPDAGWDESPVKLETREDIGIVWLDRPPANSISPEVVQALQRVWDAVKGSHRALVFASANPMLFCAGADIKAFTTMDAAAGKDLIDQMHALLREMERSSVVTIAAVNAIAFGGGCELAMACDFRIAAESATFGQPEINLGIIPGFGGTQRLARLVGEGKALELNLIGDPIGALEAYELGLATRVVPDHELLDTALAWARKLAGQAPLAIEQIKQVSAAGDIDEGIEAEKRGFATAFGSEDAKEGIGAFLGKRKARFQGR